MPVPAGFNYDAWLGSTPQVPYTLDRVMPLNIRDEDTNRLAEKLASRMRSKKTAAVKSALRNELDRLEGVMYLRTLYLVCIGYRRDVTNGVPFGEWGFLHPAGYYRATAAATRAAFRR